MKKIKKSDKVCIWSAILSIISSFALIVNNISYEPTEGIGRASLFIKQIRSAFEDASYYVLFFVVLAFIAFLHLIPKNNKKLLKISIPFSIIAAFFLLLCDSYYQVASWDNVFGSMSAVVISLFKGAGAAVLAFFMYDIVNRISIEKLTSPDKAGVKDFVKITLIMFVCWIPYMIIFSPGLMNCDVNDQFAQIMGNREVCWSTTAAEGESILNNHHPIFHTFILGAFLKLGEAVGSYFAGIELFSILQCLAFTAALSLSLIKMKQHGMSKKLLSVFLLIFAFCPLFPLWGMTLMKDTAFSIVFLVTIVLIYDAVADADTFRGKKCIPLAIAVLLLMLMRNNGFYMLLAFLPFVIIHFRKDKKFLVRIAAVLLIPMIIFKVGVTGIMFSQLDIEEGGKQEMLSIPLQQTARYISEYKDEVTQEEEQAILGVLYQWYDGKPTLDKIAEDYVPYISDPIKSMYGHDVTNDQLAAYLKVWAKQLIKHPDVYVEAFLNMNYSWFSFDTNQGYIFFDAYNGVDEDIPKWLDGIDNPEKLHRVSRLAKKCVNFLHEIPVVNCAFEFSFYTWAYVIIFIAMLIRKKYKEMLACLPIFINYAICFIGPIAYLRYALPMIVCLPFVIFITFSRDKNNKEEMKNISTHEIWLE